MVRGMKDTLELILNLATGWEVSGQLHPPTALLTEKRPLVH
jgi:hypothetical protein